MRIFRILLASLLGAAVQAADRPVSSQLSIPLLDCRTKYPAGTLVVAPDGSWAALHRWPYPATGTPPLILQFWNLKTGTLTHSVAVEGNRIWHQVVSPDGRKLFLSVERGKANVGVVIDTESGRQFTLPDSVPSALGFTPDGSSICGYVSAMTGREARIGVWSIPSGEKLREFGVPDFHRVKLGPDGKTAHVRTSNGIGDEIWDFEKGEGVSTLTIKGETKLYHNDFLGFDRRCKKVVTEHWNDELRVFDVVTGVLERTAKVPKATPGWSSVRLHGISDDLSTVMAATYEGQPTTFEPGKDHWSFTVPAAAPMYHGWPVLTRDGKSFLRTHPAYGVEVFDAITGRRIHTLRPDTQQVRALAFAADGKTLVAGVGNDPRQRMSWEPEDPPAGHLMAWDPATGELKKAVAGLDPGVCNVFPAADGTKAVAVLGYVFQERHAWEQQRAELWELTTGKRLQTIATRDDWMYSFTGSADGRRISAVVNERRKTGDYYSVLPVGTRVWNLATGERERDLAAAPDSSTIAITPDGERLLAMSRKGAVESWGVESGKSRPVFNSPLPTGKEGGGPFIPVALPRGDGFIALTGQQSYIHDPVRLYVDNRQIAFGKIDMRPGPLAVSPDGKWAAASERPYVGPARVFVWKVPEQPPLDENKIKDGVIPPETAWVDPIVLNGHTGQIHALAFSPDGKTLATGGEDCAIRLWEVATGRLKATLWAPPSVHPKGTPTDWVAYTPEGSFAGTKRGVAFLRRDDVISFLGYPIPTGRRQILTTNDASFEPAKVRAALGVK